MVRLCVAARSSTSAGMSSSARTAAARHRRPRGHGLYDGQRPRDLWGSGGAFVSGSACWRTVSGKNYGHNVGYGSDVGAPGAATGPPQDPGFRFPLPYQGPFPLPPPSYGLPLPPYRWQPPPQAFGPQHSPYGPPPPPPPRYPLKATPGDFRSPPARPWVRPADYRSWVLSSLPPPPPECQRFRVLSYNILADYLARDHQPKLYFHIPPELLDWDWRKGRLLIEFGLWSPDIMCLQEVDKFQDLEKELAPYGYNGTWKMRTGNAVDGCAIFWRTDRFVLRHEEHIEFAKLGLRDNVAQICVLESGSRSPADNGSEALSARSNSSLKTDRVVVCNIHVLYNPKRGDIKLGQVRVLLDRAYSVSKIWNDAPVIICGDFNCIPKSPLYNFISGQKLSLSGLDRTRVSGQYDACIYPPRPSTGSGLFRGHPPRDINDGKAASVELNNHQSEVGENHVTQHNMESTLLVDSSSFHVSEKVCTYSQLDNETRREFDATPRVDEFDCLPLCKEKDTSIEALKDITESSEAMPSTESERVDNLTSTNAPSQRNLHTASELQSDEKYVEQSSFVVETMREPDEQQVNAQQFVMPGNKGMLHGPLDSLIEVKHKSSIHMSYTFSTTQEDIIDFKMTESTSHSGHSMLPFEGNKNVFNPENASENILEFKSESENFPADLESKSESDNFPDGVSLDSSGLLDTQLDLEGVDSSVNCVKEMESASSGSDQPVVEAPEKLPSITGDIALKNITYSNSSSQYSGNGAFSTGTDIEASSCLVEEEVNLDSSFLEELHGTGNVPQFSQGMSVTSLSGQPMSPSFPDPSTSQSIGEGEVESGRLNSNISHQSRKIQYDPFRWTPMEIEAASGNAECTLLEHNLNLKSAYTEVKDYVGTKDSSGEPQVTSYNAQFMGTVDYIWHSERIQTVRVLDTIPKHVLRRTLGFPTKKWGSDHLALACEFAFKEA